MKQSQSFLFKPLALRAALKDRAALGSDTYCCLTLLCYMLLYKYLCVAIGKFSKWIQPGWLPRQPGHFQKASITMRRMQLPSLNVDLDGINYSFWRVVLTWGTRAAMCAVSLQIVKSASVTNLIFPESSQMFILGWIDRFFHVLSEILVDVITLPDSQWCPYLSVMHSFVPAHADAIVLCPLWNLTPLPHYIWMHYICHGQCLGWVLPFRSLAYPMFTLRIFSAHCFIIIAVSLPFLGTHHNYCPQSDISEESHCMHWSNPSWSFMGLVSSRGPVRKHAITVRNWIREHKHITLFL